MSARRSLCCAFGALGLGLLGCATGAVERRPIELADEAFARGEYADAETGFRRSAEDGAVVSEAARARLFALLARRASSPAEALDEVQVELRAFAVAAAGTPWGRLAQLYADEMAQVDALRWAVQRSGAELSAIEQQKAELAGKLARTEEVAAELTAQLQTIREERGQLQRTLKEREELLAQQLARIAELEAELEALKSIDMSRTP